MFSFSFAVWLVDTLSSTFTTPFTALGISPVGKTEPRLGLMSQSVVKSRRACVKSYCYLMYSDPVVATPHIPDCHSEQQVQGS